MREDLRARALDLCAFIDSAPSPYHVALEVARRLERAGFQRVPETDPWPEGAGRLYALRGGALVALAQDGPAPPERGLAVIGAHTDSPNLRVKPRPDSGAAGWRQLGVEVYGGVLLNSWLDRDLGLSGRVALRGADGPTLRPFRVDRPLLRVPQLAIHLDREITTQGLNLDRQRHLAPVWGLGRTEEDGFRRFLAAELGCEADDVLSWEAMCHDLTPARLLGRDEELLAAPRLDNLASCFAGVEAVLARLEQGGEPRRIPALCFFDHEEVGSASSSGAQSPILSDLFERSVIARGGGRGELLRCLADSVCVSADMAHATHPNYPERHEPGHWIEVNGGPVIKINANQRYATDAETEARFAEACRQADVPVQRFVNRTDLACGSTIGPLTAARLGLRTVDVGAPQLSMHSARELAGARDTGFLVRALTQFLQ